MAVKRNSSFRRNSRGINSQRFAPNRITAALIASFGAFPVGALAGNTITLHNGSYANPNTGVLLNDLKTQTTITVSGAVTDITTQSVRGQTGFNSFGRFEVDTGNTVNLHVPGGASNLVNLVHDAKAVVNGTLNGLKDGKIGGNIIFADPHGMVVGASGVVNVGSLTVTTPSTQAMTDLMLAATGAKVGGVNMVSDSATADLVDALKDGTLDRSSNGAVEIQGQVNSNASINLFAASAVIGAAAQLQAGTDAAAAVFASTVNVDDVAIGAGVALENGTIKIVAADSVEISGELAALMADNSGGSVQVKAGKRVELKGDAKLLANGEFNKNGGNVTVEAPSITLSDRAQINTRTTGTGKSGNITLTANSDQSFSGDEAQTVEELKTQLADQAKVILAAHLGKAEVTIGKDAKLDAGHANGTANAGDVTVTAVGFDKQMSGYADAAASIDVAGSITGRDVILRAASESRVTGSLLGSLFSSDALGADFAKLKEANNWSDAETWSNIIDTLGDASSQTAQASDLGTLGLDPTNWSELAALLPFLTAAIANADADVTIDSSAVIQALRDIKVQADSTRYVDTSTGAIPGLSGKLPFNLGAAYGRLSGTTQVDVASGARLTAGQDLVINALSDNTLKLESTATNSKDGDGKQTSTAGFAFGMAHTDIDTLATVNKGAVLSVGRDASLTALTEQELSNQVTFKSIGEGAVGGPAIALTLFDSTTRAVWNADLAGTRNLDVSAINMVYEQSNSSSVQAGKALENFVTTKAINTAKPLTDYLASKVKPLFGMSPNPSETKPTESKFRLASALAIGIADHEAEAIIGSNGTAPTLSLTGDLSVQALQQQSALHNSAESTVNANADKDDGTKVSLSVAAVYSQLQQQTRALIGDGSTITAGRIGLGAQNIQLLDLNGLDRWGSLNDIYSNLKLLAGSLPDVPGMLSTSYANSTGEADKLSMTGSFSVLINDLDATAWVGDNVKLTATNTSADSWSNKPLDVLDKLYDEDGDELDRRKDLRDLSWTWAGPLAVQAKNEVQQLGITGNLWWSLFNNNSDGGAVGAGVNVQVSGNQAIAGIGANGTLKAKRITVNAEQDELLIGISPSAGKGASVAGNGAVVVNVADATVHASIHNSTAVDADQVSVEANHKLGMWSAAGALSSSENTGVGASVAVNYLDTDVLALVGDNRAWRPSDVLGSGINSLTKATWKVDEVLVNAESTGQVGAFSVAGAMAKTEEEKKQQEELAAKDGGGDSGSTQLASGLGDALLQTLTNGITGVTDGLSAAKTEATKVKDTIVDVPDKLKGYWDKFTGLFSKDSGGSDSGGQEPGSKLTLAIAGSGSVNVSGQKTRAHLGDIVLDPRDPAKGSKVTVLSLNQTNQFSGSGAGALTLAGGKKSEFSSAISGAVAYNHLFNVTEALLTGATLHSNDLLKVQAASGGDQIAMGLGLSVSTGGNTNVAVALSGSGAVVANTTRAAVENSRVEQRSESVDGIAVTAYDRSRLLIGGGAFAGSNGKGGSAGGAMALGLVLNKLQAEWLGSTATGFKRLDVSANSASRVLAGAVGAAISTGQESGAGSGALFVVVMNNDVTAKVDAKNGTASSLTGGAVNVNAQSVSGAQALDSLFSTAAQTSLADAGLDLDGSSTTEGIDGQVATDDDLFDEGGDAGTTSSHNLFTGELAGEAVLGIAGNLAATGGKAAVGGALGVVYTGSDYSASVANTAIDLTGDLNIAASNNTDVLAAAIGAAGGNGTAVSGSGTIVIARGSVEATLDMTGRTLKADDLSVTAVKSGGSYSLAGNITGSSQNASVGGAFSLSDMQQTVDARIANGTYTLTGDASLRAGMQSRIITAALSGAVSGSGVAVGGALTYNRIADTTTALLQNATMSARNLAIAASQPDLGASIWSVAFNLAAAGGSAGVGAAVAVNLIDAERTAKLADSTVNLTGDATLSSALDGEIWGLGVDAAGGNTAGVGGSFVVNNINGSDTVSVENSTLTTSGSGKALTVDASGGNGLTIASLTGSITGGGTAAVGGAISVNRIGADRTALVKGSTISGFSSASLLSGVEQTIYAIAVAGGGAGTVAVNGSSTSNILDGDERAAIEGGTFTVGSLNVSAAVGERTIWSLAGAISGAGTTAVGVANANNIILAKRDAEILNATLNLTGALQLESGGAAHIRSAAVGGGGAGTAAAGASIAVNVIQGEENALLSGSTVSGASAVNVEVIEGDADIKTLAGNVQGAGTGAGAGAVAVSTIEQKRQAKVVDSLLTLSATAPITVQAATRARIDTVAVSGAGAGTGAAVFSNTSNNIAAVTLASVENSGGTAGKLSLLSSDSSTINALAGGAAGAGTVAVGAATAINRVDSEIESRLTGSKGTGWDLSTLLVDADSAATIRSAAISGGGAGNVAVLGSFATNIIQTQARAHLGGGARVIAQNNLGVSASNLDSIIGIAGAAAGSGNASVGASVTVNLIESQTRAYIDGSTTEVSALGKDASDTLEIDSGELLNAPSDDHEYWASSGQFNPVPNLGIGKRNITGLAVQASSLQQVGQMSVTASASFVPLYSGAVAGLSNTSVIAGSTSAYIDSAKVNQASGAGSAQNVRVGANSHSFGASYLASLSFSLGVTALSGTLDSTVISRETRAYLRGTTLASKGAAEVNAGSSQYASSVIASAAGGITGGAGSAGLLVLKGTTEALVDGGSALTVGSLKVKASALQQLSPSAVAIAGGAVGAGGTFVMVYNQSQTRAWVGEALTAPLANANTTVQGAGAAVNIEASNDTRLLLNAAGASGGGAALAGSAAISVIETTTEAGASQADFGTDAAKLGSLTVNAKDSVRAMSNAGAASVGAQSIGGSANVLVANSATRALFDRSSLKATGAFNVKALREGDFQLNTVTAGAGSTALGGSIGLLLLGSGSTTVTAGGQTSNPLDELDKGGNGTLSQANSLGNADKSGDLSYQDYVWNSTSQEYELVTVKDGAAKTSVNSSSKNDLVDRLSASSTRKHETVARVSDSSITAGGASEVSAQDKLYSRNLAGNAVLGMDAAAGGAFAFTLSNALVTAEILSSTLNTGSLSVKAEALGLKSDPAVTVQSLSGSAGFGVGLGASVGVAVMNNKVNTNLGGNLTASGALNGSASDTQAVKVDALGASAGVGVGAGLVLGVAAHDSQVGLSVSPNAVLTANSINLSATSAGPVTLTARGAAGGILAGVNASILVARDQSKAKVDVGTNARLLASNGLTLKALAMPKVSAEALGVSLGGYLSAGATVIDALAKSEALLKLGAGARLQAAQASLTSQVARNGNADSVNVDGLGVAGGVGVSANAVVAKARNESSSQLISTDSTEFVGVGNASQWSFLAATDIRQYAETTGAALGLLTLGAHVAEASANATTQALVNGRFSGGIGKLSVAASASVDNEAHSTAGQGGLVSGAASIANTDDNSTTKAYLYARGTGSSQASLGAVTLSALHQSRFNAFVNSVNAALVGASGAHAQNRLDLKTSAELASNSYLTSSAYDQSARAEVTKPDSGGYNVESGSGGVVDAAAALSTTTIKLTTQSLVGSNVRLRLDGDWRNPEHLRIQAFNNVFARDKVKLDSGGAISIAKAVSQIDVSQANAKVDIASSADIYSVGDLILSASGNYDIDARANAKTYGLAGAAMGESLARVSAQYDVLVGSNAKLFSYGDTKFYAGYSIAGTMNKATLTARTDLWNNTAFPVVNDPEADATYIRNSNVTVSSGVSARSVGDIYAYAGKGYSVLVGQGVGKDLYREAAAALLNALGGNVSLDITGGSTNNGGTANVTVNGQFDTGVYSKQSLQIDGLKYYLNGVEINPANAGSIDLQDSDVVTVAPIVSKISDGITYSMRSGEYSQLISSRIETLRGQMANYGLSPFEKAAFQAELNLLQQTLAKIYEQMGGNPATGSLPGKLQVWILDVDPILARPGNIYVTGDALVGSGKLNAPGDAKIEIVNNSAAFLSLKGLEIPDREGGQLLFNDVKVGSNANINALNKTLSGAGFSSIQVAENSPSPQITVTNTYNPANGVSDAGGLKAPAPDIYVNGQILNKRGEIAITAAYGSIYANADIRGQTLKLSAGQDFVLNNTDGFTHIGGDPAKNNNGSTLNGSASSTVAGNNVVINALYLNINGLVQSGVADWKVTINDGDLANLASLRNAWKNGGAAVVQLVQTDARTGTVGYSYDFRNESLVLDKVEVAGGYMELTGHILSTGNGQLKVLDGYNQVAVVNNTGSQLRISGIDLGSGVEGTLRINDVGRVSGSTDGVWSTIYTHVGDQVQRYEGWSDAVKTTSAFLKGTSNGRDTTYSTTAGRTYVWLQGRDTSETTTKVEYWDKFWDFIPTGDGTLLSLDVKKGDSTPIAGAEYMGSSPFYIDTSKIPMGDIANWARLVMLSAKDPNNAELVAYRSYYSLSEGQVLTQKDQRYTTDAKELINESMGGYCKKHFIWCQVYRTTRTRVYLEGFKEIDRYTVRADSPINISFIGYEAGKVDLTSKGSVTMLGSIYNQNGATNITVRNGGSLTQANDSAMIAARDLTLNVANGIGDSIQALRVQVGNNLSAYAAAGNINLQALKYTANQGVNLSRLEAANGNVTLAAQGNISANGGVVVKGKSITLDASGSIGSSTALLNLDTGSPSSDNPALLKASGTTGVFVEEVSGDLWLDQIVSTGGDVAIKVRNGDLLDGNSDVSYDERGLSELQDLWDSMGLTGSQASAALAEQKQTLIDAGNQRYARYWQLRQLTQNPDGSWQAAIFDENQAKLGAAQVDQLKALGWSDAKITAEQTRRIDDYKAMNAEFGAQAYSTSYQYALEAGDSQALDSTAAWTSDQLRYSIASSLLNRGSSSSATNETMNVQGRNVSLDANRIGKLLDADVVIDLSGGAASLTTAQRAALAGAEQDDIYFDASNPLRFSIAQRDDVNVTATGTISATADGDIYLGGQQDFNIYNVDGQTVRIKTDGNIESANGGNVVVKGHDVVLEAGNGSIGANGGLHTQVTGNLTARADLLHLINHGNLSIQRLTGLDSLTLKVLGNLTSASQLGENLLGGSVNLTVTGDAGSEDDRVQIGTGGVNDEIVLDIDGNAWIGGLQGTASSAGILRLGDATVGGALDIGQTRDLTQTGDWSLGGLYATLGGNWTMADGSSVTAANGLFARVNGAATLADLVTTGTNASLDIEAYTLAATSAGDSWSSANTLRLRGYGDIGSSALYATLAGENLDVGSTTGRLYANLAAGIRGGSLVTAGDQFLVSRGTLELTSVSSLAGAVQLRGAGLVDIASLSARDDLDLAGASLRLGNAQSLEGGLLIDLSGNLEADTLAAHGNWMLDAASATVGSATVGGNVQHTLSGDLQLG
ncbi:leukotoxin LktA family filamentous adhesin, partial [Pseudomonas stutzeri]|uniref:leukotoxin LktA family filamentous adhesin n=1 Tax=Stutzerimonas stutzeri TaxID=316 RepID=UPI0021096B87